MRINAKRTIVGAALAILFGGGLAGPSNAIPLDQITGPVEFKFFAGSTSQNTFGGPCAVGAGCENTWLGSTLTQIVDSNTLLPVFNQGENGQYLAAILYGVSDISITGSSPNFNIYSAGATSAGTGGVGDGRIYIDVYLRGAPPDLSGGPANRTGYNTYTGISDGASLWLRVELTEGIALDDPSTLGVDESDATLFQTATSATNPSSGEGTFFGNVVGGSAQAQFDTNGTLIPNTGGFADMFGIFDFRENTTSGGIPGCTPPGGVADVQPDCWENFVSDPIRALAVPEPTTIGLTGMALLLMAAAHRRRRR